MIITVSGDAGCGKTTVGKILVERLRAERVYVGGIRRDMAKAKGMDLAEFNRYGENHPETDIDVDNKVRDEAREIEKQGKIVIVEGRTQYHFLPESVKVFISVSPNLGAERVWKDLQENKEVRNEDSVHSLEEVKLSLKNRLESDIKRYLKYYGINPYGDMKQYDLVVDSSNISAEKVADKIIEFLNSKKLM